MDIVKLDITKMSMAEKYDSLNRLSKDDLIKLVLNIHSTAQLCNLFGFEAAKALKQKNILHEQLDKMEKEMKKMAGERMKLQMELDKIKLHNIDVITIYANKIRGTNKIYIGKSIQKDGASCRLSQKTTKYMNEYRGVCKDKRADTFDGFYEYMKSRSPVLYEIIFMARIDFPHMQTPTELYEYIK